MHGRFVLYMRKEYNVAIYGGTETFGSLKK
jgi:hypothetical protein